MPGYLSGVLLLLLFCRVLSRHRFPGCSFPGSLFHKSIWHLGFYHFLYIIESYGRKLFGSIFSIIGFLWYAQYLLTEFKNGSPSSIFNRDLFFRAVLYITVGLFFDFCLHQFIDILLA